MQPVLACFTRLAGTEEHTPNEEWLSQQLKGARDQLCKKSDLCEQLADRLRDLEVDLRGQRQKKYEARELLNATNSELRAAGRARQQQEAEFTDLRTQAETIQKEADALRVREAASEAQVARLQSQATSACESETAKQAEIADLRQRLAEQELAVQIEDESHASCLDEQINESDIAAGGSVSMPTSPREAKVPRRKAKDFAMDSSDTTAFDTLRENYLRLQATAAAREAELLQQLEHERELREEALRNAMPSSPSSTEQKTELQQEFTALSSNLEQKEEDLLSIKFDMVELQNRLADQARLVSENADAFQQASEELADKDERLGDALARQEELVSQMNDVSEKLQGKVERLSQELDRSRSAYQALEEQTRVVVSGLEKESDVLISELKSVRSEASEAACWNSSLQAELDRLRAAFLEKREKAEAQQEAPSHNSLLADAEELAALKLREAALQQAYSNEKLRASELQDQLVAASERLDLAEVQLTDLSLALEGSQLMERQAVERAQEYRTSLGLYREFGKEDFMRGDLTSPRFPSPRSELEDLSTNDGECSMGVAGQSCISSVLVSVEMDLGFATANLSIAPWQTRADFDTVVQNFLQEHKVRPIFGSAIVRYLEEVEANAITFPVHVSASLVDVYSRYC